MNMEENFNALDVIARTWGKVELDSLPYGDRLFPLWGGLAAWPNSSSGNGCTRNGASGCGWASRSWAFPS